MESLLYLIVVPVSSIMLDICNLQDDGRRSFESMQNERRNFEYLILLMFLSFLIFNNYRKKHHGHGHVHGEDAVDHDVSFSNSSFDIRGSVDSNTSFEDFNNNQDDLKFYRSKIEWTFDKEANDDISNTYSYSTQENIILFPNSFSDDDTGSINGSPFLSPNCGSVGPGSTTNSKIYCSQMFFPIN